MVKLFTFAALVLAAALATARATPINATEAAVPEAVVAETAPDVSAAVPASSPFDKRQRRCCKTTVAKCELFTTSVRNPGAKRAIWQNDQGTKMVAYDFSGNGKWGKDGNWYTECRAGYCYAVHGQSSTCRFYVQSYPDNYGECTAKGWWYETCKPSFCAVYC